MLLILPSATYKARDFLQAAKRLGAKVVIATDEAQALAGVMGDRFLLLPLDDPHSSARIIAEHSKRVHFDAVVAVDDQGTLAATAAAEMLGLAHNPFEATAATRDKLAMRKKFAASQVPQPAFAVLEPGSDPGAVAGSIGFPCVLKPISLSGSRGVIRADDTQGARSAAERIWAMLASLGGAGPAELLVEEFIPGVEVAVDGLLSSGSLQVLAIFDKPDPLDGPYFEETIYVTPSRLTAREIAAIREATSSAAHALGLVEGPVHAELRLHANKALAPTVIEIAARNLGGLCARILTFGTGISLEEIVLAHALHKLEALPKIQAGAAGVMMLPIPAGGTLAAVEGRKEALQVPGITGLEITIPLGARVYPLPEGDRYLGFLFAHCEDPRAAELALRTAFASLDIQIIPTEPPD